MCAKYNSSAPMGLPPMNLLIAGGFIHNLKQCLNNTSSAGLFNAEKYLDCNNDIVYDGLSHEIATD